MRLYVTSSPAQELLAAAASRTESRYQISPNVFEILFRLTQHGSPSRPFRRQSTFQLRLTLSVLADRPRLSPAWSRAHQRAVAPPKAGPGRFVRLPVCYHETGREGSSDP